jgi:hypothetical protein
MIQEAFPFPHPIQRPLHEFGIHADSFHISGGFVGTGGELAGFHHISCIA